MYESIAEYKEAKSKLASEIRKLAEEFENKYDAQILNVDFIRTDNVVSVAKPLLVKVYLITDL